ncbi:MAG: oxygen-independent coproporphyrinogen III oxidase [Opitutales bacterium]|nr:oxygen-independent coproporphyrinogen III oxidase [Opitutales bacterium]
MKTLKELIEKYETAGPRYTSYPTAPHFSPDADKKKLAALALGGEGAAAFYMHIPFCKSLCWFCGCTSDVCRDQSLADKYLSLVERELELWREAGLKRREIRQLHLGGGTPNFLEPAQIERLGATVKKYFSVSHECEFSAEFDPRTLTKEKADAFAAIGVNRASIGIQDTNPEVQKAINRIQPQEMNEGAARMLRSAGVAELNIDLIYGLPLQTPETFAKTLSDALSLNPTRVALFGYAHVPWLKPAQKNLEKYPMPAHEKKLEIFLLAKDFFEKNGFEYVGLDHFAKPDDPLIEARKNGTLHRNFQGYTTHAGLDNFAVGLTSISETKTSYRQNFKTMPEYEGALARGSLPIERGIVLDADDTLRRAVIMDVMCALKVVYDNYGVDFKKVFAPAMPKLEDMAKDRLVELFPDRFEVLPEGRFFLRNIAMLFDGRLAKGAQRYSKTV